MNLNRILGTIIYVLILILLIAFYINNKDNKNNLIFILCATIIYICYLLEFVRKPNLNTMEAFRPAHLDYKMGEYSGIKLNNDGQYNIRKPKSNNKCGYRKRPCNISLLNDPGYVTPTGIEKKYVEDPDHNPTLPSVDGTKTGRRSMFMFTHNQSHPDCCPSTYSTSTGCVCTTKQQREFVNKRGGNRMSDIYPGI